MGRRPFLQQASASNRKATVILLLNNLVELRCVLKLLQKPEIAAGHGKLADIAIFDLFCKDELSDNAKFK